MVLWFLFAVLCACAAIAIIHPLVENKPGKDSGQGEDTLDRLASQAPGQPQIKQTKTNAVLAISLAAWIALGTMGLYLFVGHPQFAEQTLSQQTGELERQMAESLIEPLRQSVAQDPENTQNRHLLGVSLLAVDRLQEAQSVFEGMIADDTANADTFARFAETLIVQSGGDIPEKAQAALHQAYTLQPEIPIALEYLGRALYKKRLYSAAQELWSFLLQQDGLHPDMRLRLQNNLKSLNFP